MTDLTTTSPAPLTTPPDDSVIQMWLHGRSPHTRRCYVYDINRFRAFVIVPLALVPLHMIQGWADQLTGATRTRNRAMMAVKSLYSFAHKLGYLPFNTAAALKANRVDAGVRAERILSQDEIHRMLDLETGRNKTMLRFLYASGLRVAELTSLTWRDFTPLDSGGVVTVTGKGNKTRAINIPEPVWSEVMALRGDATHDDRPFGLHQTTVWGIVSRAAKRAGIDKSVSTHWLRHGMASHALDNGAPIALVQRQLGHANLTTTGQYLHARPSDAAGKYLRL